MSWIKVDLGALGRCESVRREDEDGENDYDHVGVRAHGHGHDDHDPQL